jgi:outer membrane protein OmpA-like peptidoglycan-associated protein/tetratricopeptide (TPR) repeat protein
MLLAYPILLATALAGQSSIAEIRKKADQHFAQEQYRTALHLYRQAGQEHSSDKAVRLNLAICLYAVNEVDNAIRILQLLNNEGKTDPNVFFYTARCYEAKNLFAEAITNYKKFLQRSKQDHAKRDWVKDQLVRCSNGLRLKYADELAYVENAGTVLNTEFNEFGVKNSPTTLGKIYFNSDHPDPAVNKVANGNVDIFTSTLENGRWSAPALLPAHINSPDDEEVFGFSTNGQILYYLVMQENQLQVRTDTFSLQGETYKGYFNGPFDPNAEGGELTFFNDTICLFSSTRPDGYGGYDLYIAFFENGRWSQGINLGPVINSHYDERFPFLTRNGLTLFYSTNNLQSVGGFDILTTTFDPGSKTWSSPENLGFPVNSSGNETYMDVAPDGMTAFLTSDRKDGYGENDLYRVFFKEPLIAHQSISLEPTFQQFLLTSDVTQPTPPDAVAPVAKKEYYISHLYYEDASDILTPQNVKKLDLIVNLMLIYPQITVELSCFEVPAGQRTYSVYYSIKKNEEVAAYLQRKGITPDRIQLKGYGSSFPLATLPAGITHHPLFTRLNQRIEITLHHYEKEPVIIHLETIQVPQNMQDPAGFRFNALRHGFYYSVQIASITQILQSNNLESLDEIFIDVDPVTGHYRYMSGMVTSFQEANELHTFLMNAGFHEAEIIPYVNGLRIQPSEMAAAAQLYPDLLFFLESKR